jgi:hypothetical protein
MASNPITDSWAFSVANMGDYNNLGPAKYGLASLFIMLLLGSAGIAWLNWSRDPAQRTGKPVSVWLLRAYRLAS